MSNNRYKNAFNQIEVSDRAIDNLYDIATKKQRRTNNVAKMIIATATAFILVIGGGFGINYSISDKKSVGIYIASADEVASIKMQAVKISLIRHILPMTQTNKKL